MCFFKEKLCLIIAVFSIFAFFPEIRHIEAKANTLEKVRELHEDVYFQKNIAKLRWAIDILEKLRESEPDNPLVIAYLGGCYSLLTRDSLSPRDKSRYGDIAWEFLGMAIEMEPNNPEILWLNWIMDYNAPFWYRRRNIAYGNMVKLNKIFQESPTQLMAHRLLFTEFYDIAEKKIPERSDWSTGKKLAVSLSPDTLETLENVEKSPYLVLSPSGTYGLTVNSAGNIEPLYGIYPFDLEYFKLGPLVFGSRAEEFIGYPENISFSGYPTIGFPFWPPFYFDLGLHLRSTYHRYTGYINFRRKFGGYNGYMGELVGVVRFRPAKRVYTDINLSLKGGDSRYVNYLFYDETEKEGKASLTATSIGTRISYDPWKYLNLNFSTGYTRLLGQAAASPQEIENDDLNQFWVSIGSGIRIPFYR